MFGLFKKKDKSPANLWSSFVGKGDSEKVLEEKAKLFAVVLLDWLKEGTDNLIKRVLDGKETPTGMFGQIFFESAIFCIQYTDRIAASTLSEDQRRVFIDSLTAEIQTLLAEGQPDEEAKKRIHLLFMVQNSDRQKEYSRYKFVAEKEEGYANTLFWEFEKKIVRIFGFEEDIITLMDVHVSISSILNHLQIPNLLETK